MVGLSFIQVQLETKSWMRTTGIIISSKLSPRSFEVAGFDPDIKYEYSVNGSKFIGNQFRNIKFEYTYNSAEKIIQQYSPGEKVNVYYNPKFPDQAILDNELKWYDFILVTIATLLFFAAYRTLKENR